jgi:hypothetical protein
VVLEAMGRVHSSSLSPHRHSEQGEESRPFISQDKLSHPFLCHPELVSGSVEGTTPLSKILKQVQYDTTFVIPALNDRHSEQSEESRLP